MDVRKIVLVVCDGMGDRPVEDFGGKTPLEHANTPNMDLLAREGSTGVVDIIAPGVTPGSDTAHLSLLGYDAREIYTGRGPFEAAGAGLEVRPGDVAFRCNFATLEDGVIIDRRAGRIREGTEELAGVLDGMEIEDVKVLFKAGVEHRAALVLRGEGLSQDITDADPHETGRPVLEVKPLKPGDTKAEKTARILNTFIERSHEMLDNHDVNVARREKGLPPANIILPRGPGMVPHIPRLEDRTGLRAAGVVGVTLIRGICWLTGMTLIEDRRFTGGRDTDMMAKARATVEALETHDFVLVNIKAPDLAGHDGQPREKAEIIERIDEAVGYIYRHMPEDTILAVTADHSTPCGFMEHAGDPVPLVIYGRGHRRDRSQAFGETECSSGGLGRIRGKDLFHILYNMAGRAEKFGA
ncbi:MAG: 2,3-bisphosphoglycerate-independent phosphoglycerate mutase [Thermoplasmata archaeon]|nr:2,3-bisphosphoglycerate-independent phosphoglycerate mutase [Thermoplasmata archaeon]